MSQEITIEISPAGDVKVETKGFVGSSCKDATKALEKELGATVKDTPTQEAYQHGQSTVRNRG